MFNSRRLQLLRIRNFHLEQLIDELADLCRANGVDLPPVVHQPGSVTIAPAGTMHETPAHTDYSAIEAAIARHKEVQLIRQVVRQELPVRQERPRTGMLKRMPPSPTQPKWWYVSPSAYSIGPFDSEAAMEQDIALHYVEDDA